MFKGLSNLSSMLGQARQMGAKMQELQESLKARRAVGSAGAGLVEFEVNGLGEVLRVTIAPELAARGDREILEDLILAAANQAQQKSKALHAEAMKEMTAGMSIPGLDEAMAQLGGGMPPG